MIGLENFLITEVSNSFPCHCYTESVLGVQHGLIVRRGPRQEAENPSLYYTNGSPCQNDISSPVSILRKHTLVITLVGHCFISENVSLYLANFELSRQTILGGPEGIKLGMLCTDSWLSFRATGTTGGVQAHGDVEELAEFCQL